MITIGRIKTVLVKRITKLLVREHPDEFNEDFNKNKEILKKYADLCIVTKSSLKTLEERLKKRKYTKSKIRENLDAEIFDVCLNEAKEKGHNMLVFDTTEGISISKICNKINSITKNKIREF